MVWDIVMYYYTENNLATNTWECMYTAVQEANGIEIEKYIAAVSYIVNTKIGPKHHSTI